MERNLSKSAKADLMLVDQIKSENKIVSEKAFSDLYTKYRDSMMYHFKNFVKDEVEAEELVLDAFMKVSNNIEKFNDDAGVFSTWMFKLTKNLFIDRLRKRKLNTVSLNDLAKVDEDSNAIEYEISSIDKNPEEKILLKEKYNKVNEIVNKMANKKLAAYIKLRYFDGLSYEEISKKMNCPLGDVKTSLHRAKLALKDEFENVNLKF